MAESNPDPGMPLPPPQKSHWRAYAAVVAILAALVTVANGVNALVKFPSSAAQLRDWMWPGSASAPIMLTIAKDATKPAPGHGRMDLAGVGDVMGGGADVRLVMQTHDAGKIVQVSKLTAKVTRLNPPAAVAFNDSVDPLAQPGFGAARPDTFQVNIRSESDGSASYIRDAANADSASYPDLLPSSLVYQFGGADKPQQTLDLKLRLLTAGIYEVRFVATTVSEGHENVVESEPIRIGRK